MTTKTPIYIRVTSNSTSTPSGSITIAGGGSSSEVNSWGDPNGWNPGGVPNAADDVVITPSQPGVQVSNAHTVAINTVAGTSVQYQAKSIRLTDANAHLLIGSKAPRAGSVALSGGTINLSTGFIRLESTATATATINNSTIQLNGGALRGVGVFDNDRLQGMLALSATAAANGNGPLQTLTIANVLTVDATQTVALRAPGGSAVTTAVSSLGFAALSGGVLLAGDPGSASVATIQATAVSLLLTNTLGLDVVGLTAVSGMSANMVNNLATTTVGPGGKLTIGDNVRSGGSFRVYSGSIDLSQNTVQQAAAYPIQMDDNNASLIIRSGQSVGVRGFRAGDTIDVKGVAATTTSTVGATAGTTTLTVGGSTISLLGPVQADATYTTASDGNGGTLITTNTNPLAAVSFLDSSVSAAAGGTHALDRIAPSDGGPSYLEWRYIDSGPDSVAISSSTPNSFLRGGSGQKALSASGGGRNVLDGGSGSSFLSGGAGNDTFFVDITSNTPVADTIRNFHAGDAVTVFGYTAANSYTVDASGGAVGSTGGTVRILSAAGGVAATVTFTGFTAAQVSSLNVIADATSGSRPYLYFNNQGV